MAEVLTNGQVTEIRHRAFIYQSPGSLGVFELCDSYEALRAERDRMAVQLADAQENARTIAHNADLAERRHYRTEQALAEAQKDTARLDWALEHGLYRNFSRERIDAAMEPQA